MKRYLFVLRVLKDDGKSAVKIYRSYEAENEEEAREKLRKECAEKKRVSQIVRTYVEI